MKRCLNCGNLNKNKYCSVSCQNKYQAPENSNKRWGEVKNFEVVCNKCNKKFNVEERSKLFPKKKKYYCSRSCANSRNWSKTDKEKKSKALKGKHIKSGNYVTEVTTECKNCKKKFTHRKSKNRTFCSKSCNTIYYNKWGRSRKGGLRSAQVQKNSRRSKNEIYFYELCKDKFKKVIHNEPIFNGWDADVIIEDLKIAVMWNGAWHYKKITRAHSVAQVQNRDKIKVGEIKSCGYTPYIIKDMGKYNPEFVEKEFEKFASEMIAR